ncbi:hypothetical protein PV646_41925 [Streptomyces sp. ID05-26A]|nr:hypothetical protein [Streptomyces sp. ID05-26A]
MTAEDLSVAGIFINFQVGDGDEAALALDEGLSREFGRDEVFRSSRSISLGNVFQPDLLGGVRGCRVLLVVIGPRWNTEVLHDPENWVRKEIAEALRLGKQLIPMLFGRETMMPEAAQLPEDIRELVDRQNAKLSHRDLHVWLQFLPGHLIEVEPELGIGVVAGLCRLNAWWLEQVESTKLPSDFPLIGRETVVRQIDEWLAGPASTRVITAASAYEALTFVASLFSVTGPARRAVLADTEHGWRHAIRLQPLLIVTTSSDLDRDSATRRGHHVLVVADSRDDRRHDSFVLPRIPRDKASAALMAHGMSRGEADKCAGALRKSVRALMRRMTPGRSTPSWASPPVPRLAVRLTLAGAWGRTTESDQLVLQELTDLPYEDIELFAIENSDNDDPLLHKSGNRYQLADVQDAWAYLGTRLGDAGLQRWRRLAISVLFGAEASEHLRHGVAQVIAVAGVQGDDRAEQLVAELLQHANDDPSGERWNTLADVLPLLAEAAPELFLDQVDQGLSGGDPVLVRMFADTAGGFGRSPHTYLLWALGRLCWTAEHLLLGVRALARLAELDPDPDSNYRSRPLETLADALLPLMPFTVASAERQRAAIEDVLRRKPAIGWRLAVRFLAEDYGLHALTDRPAFRDWPTPFVQAPIEDWEPTHALLTTRVIEMAAANPARWPDVVRGLARVRADTRQSLVKAMVALDVDVLEPRVRMTFWWALLGHLVYFAAETPGLEEFVARLEPVDLPERHALLFNSDVMPLEAFDDYEGYVERRRQRRIAVVEEVLGAHGVKGILALASEMTDAQSLGAKVAEVVGLEMHDELFPLLHGNDASAEVASGWFAAVARSQTHEALQMVGDRLRSWDPITQGRALLALPGSTEVLNLVEAADQAAQAMYWQLTTAVPQDAGTERYLRELIARDRPEVVVGVLYLAVLRKVWMPPHPLVVRALQAAAEHRGLRHEVGVLLDHLTASGVDEDTIADLELTYVIELSQTRAPAVLYRQISTDPQKFIRLVCLAMERSDGPVKPVKGSAFIALFKCRTVPEHRQWVDESRALLAGTDHLEAGEIYIGQMLAGSSHGSDGAWPSEFVRDVLEDLASARISEGFVLGTANNHSLSVRGVYDGGDQERELSAKHAAWALQIEDRWPFTARQLRKCVEGFDAQADRWDKEAEDDHDA